MEGMADNTTDPSSHSVASQIAKVRENIQAVREYAAGRFKVFLFDLLVSG
jgi:hypothetical protein